MKGIDPCARLCGLILRFFFHLRHFRTLCRLCRFLLQLFRLRGLLRRNECGCLCCLFRTFRRSDKSGFLRCVFLCQFFLQLFALLLFMIAVNYRGRNCCRNHNRPRNHILFTPEECPKSAFSHFFHHPYYLFLFLLFPLHGWFMQSAAYFI